MSFPLTNKILSVLGIMLPLTGFAAPIYKAVLPDGRVIYTDNIDTAYKQVTDNSQITVLDNLDSKAAHNAAPTPQTTLPTVTNSNSNLSNISQLTAMNISATQASQAGDYRLVIQSPQPEMAYHRPAEQINIVLTLTPSLKQGDRISYIIDGEEIGTSNSTTLSFPSTNINLGKHSLDAIVVNNVNNPIARANLDFYIILSNPLIKKQKLLIAKKASYDALPWYQKVAQRLNGEPKPLDPKKTDIKHLDSKKPKSQ